MLPVARRQVEDNTLSDFSSILQADLEAREIRKRPTMTPALVERLVQEACRRAREGDSDGILRYGAMYRMVEEVSSDVAKIFNGDPQGDAVLKRILEHHGYKV